MTAQQLHGKRGRTQERARARRESWAADGDRDGPWRTCWAMLCSSHKLVSTAEDHHAGEQSRDGADRGILLAAWWGASAPGSERLYPDVRAHQRTCCPAQADAVQWWALRSAMVAPWSLRTSRAVRRRPGSRRRTQVHHLRASILDTRMTSPARETGKVEARSMA